MTVVAYEERRFGARLVNTSGAMPEPQTTSWQMLGGARFALAFVVLGGHLARFVQPDHVMNRLMLKIGLFDPTMAVISFLILSGFSISNSIHTKPQGYIRRRLVRIYPLYGLAIATVFLTYTFAGLTGQASRLPAQPEAASYACNLLLLQGAFCGPIPGDGPIWTLSVEAVCYALAPLLVRLHTVILLALAGASGLAYAAYPSLHLSFYSGLRWELALMFLLWTWLAGFIFYRHRLDWRFQAGLVLASAALLETNTLFSTRFTTITFLSVTMLMIYSDHIKPSRRFAELCEYLGELSYPLYLLHAIVFLFASRILNVTSAAVLTLLALLFAGIAYHAVDRPIRRAFRNRHVARASTEAS